jgi:hypothetical protein
MNTRRRTASFRHRFALQFLRLAALSLLGYTATVYPVTINLAGATPDGSGNYRIIIGQSCLPTLVGIIPAGYTASNIQWTVEGQTVQKHDWNVSADGSSATFAGPSNTFSFVQADLNAPSRIWYWDDTAGIKKVSCTATVTPPSGTSAPSP